MSELSLPLAEAADRLLSQRCDSRLVAAADAGQWPQVLWQAVEELGPGQLLAPEAEGGAGGDWVDACALLERAAARCAPLPIAQTLLAGWLRSRVGLAPAAGPAAVAFTTAPLDALRTAGRADLTEADGPVVPWAEQASHVALLGADDAGTAQLLWLPRACVHLRAVAGGTWPAARVGSTGIPLHEAAGASPTQAWCIALPGLSLAEVRARAALLSAAQIAGALGQLLEMTVTYTSERVQFGRSIGQFQAVQHQLAQLAEEAAAARVAVQAAAATEDPRWFVAAARGRGRGTGHAHRAPAAWRHRHHRRAHAAPVLTQAARVARRARQRDLLGPRPGAGHPAGWRAFGVAGRGGLHRSLTGPQR